MTTTTAKAVRAAFPRAAWPLTAPAALLALLMAPGARAELKVTPSVELRETYTDNVQQEAASLAHSAFVSELTPSLSIAANSPRVKLNASLAMHMFAYSGSQDNDGTNRNSRQLQAGGTAELLSETLFLEGTSSISQQAVSSFGPQVNNNLYSKSNRTEVRTYRISPLLKHRFGSIAVAELRYAHDQVQSDNQAFGRSSGDTLSLSLASGPSFSTVGWNAQYTRNAVADSIASKSTSEVATLGLHYRLGSSLSLTASGGYDKYDYPALGGATSGKNWTVGLGWTPSQRTSLQASMGKRYLGTTYSLAALHRSRHSSWNLNYTDAVTTSRSQFLIPAAVDTAALLDRLFRADFPDPLARQQAIDAYIRATGLPSSLANNINYLSNRYFQQKQLQASAAFNSARTTTVFSVSESKRNALSQQQTDSDLLGRNNLDLNDVNKQATANVLTNYQLSARSGVNVSASFSRSESLTTGLVDNTKALRLAMTRKFQSKLNASVELRRVQGSTSLQAGRTYRENAVAATLSMQL